MLQLIASLPPSGLEAPCTWGSLVISARGVSASIHHDCFIYMPWLEHAMMQIASHRFRGH
eukprot:5855100-Lingulodinium_polyedra.AAC.1